MAIPINIEQMTSLIDQTYNQKSGTANSITPVIEGNFLKDFLAFQNSYFVGKSDTIAPDKGGTGIAGGYAAGDIIIATAANVLNRLPKGSDGQVLTLVGGLPAWSAASGGGGGSLSSITAATSSNTINNENFTQEWTWDSISNQSGLKLSSTANGTTSNRVQKLFESVLTGAMFNTSNASYAGYFDNQQTLGAAYGIYARGYTAAQLEGIVNINGALNVNNLKISNNSGVSYIIPSSNQKLVIGGGGDAIQNSLSGCATAFSVGKKTSGSKYVYGMGMVYQSAAYISESTTNILIERDGGNMLLSANAGLTGGYNAFTPTYQIAIAGTTNNVGIGTLTPNSSAKLDVSSTTQGFAPPEMTATQASAISTTSRKLIIYVTSTNGTFTSAGLWLWTGTIWKLILAE